MSEIQAEGLSTSNQNTIQDPPEYNTEKQGSDWLGGPQNGNETPGESYQQNGQSWLGGPQNGDKTPSEAYGSGSASGFFSENAKNPKDGLDYSGVDEGNVKEKLSEGDYTKHRFDATTGESYQQNGQSWLGGPQNGNEIPGEAARNPQTGGIQKLTEADPSSSDSNPVTSTENDEARAHGKGPGNLTSDPR